MTNILRGLRSRYIDHSQVATSSRLPDPPLEIHLDLDDLPQMLARPLPLLPNLLHDHKCAADGFPGQCRTGESSVTVLLGVRGGDGRRKDR